MRRSPKEDKLPAFDLKAAREGKSLSQTAAATLLEVSQSTIARWEKDGDTPRIYRKFWNLHWQVHKPVALVQPKKGAPK